MQAVAHLFQIAIPFIWLGLVGGISFLEAPLKFRAPGLTLPVGLRIGKIVFAALNRAEGVLAILCFIAYLLGTPPVIVIALFFLVCAVMAYQLFGLRAALNRRIDVVSKEGTPPPSTYHHIAFIVAETVKMLLLLLLGIFTALAYIR